MCILKMCYKGTKYALEYLPNNFAVLQHFTIFWALLAIWLQCTPLITVSSKITEHFILI